MPCFIGEALLSSSCYRIHNVLFLPLDEAPTLVHLAKCITKDEKCAFPTMIGSMIMYNATFDRDQDTRKAEKYINIH